MPVGVPRRTRESIASFHPTQQGGPHRRVTCEGPIRPARCGATSAVSRDRLALGDPQPGLALELKPAHDRAHYGLALSLIATGRLDEAVAPLRQNTKLQPMSPYGWYQLARVQRDLGRPAETQRILDHRMSFEPAVARQLERETGLRATER